MLFDGISDWVQDRDEVIGRIVGNFRPLKILLKTKDDPEQLKNWIDYHRKIVSDDSLIIFDNMSSDPAVSLVYSAMAGGITLVRFNGYHNIVHHTEFSAVLYDALRASCSHFVFLDTDERLALFDGADRLFGDHSLQAFLSEHSSINVFPGTWLQNVTGYEDRFSFHDPISPLVQGLQWGKPVISTSCDFKGMINHNCQVDRSLYAKTVKTDFLILHLSRVKNGQRINANLKKLRNCKAILPQDGIDEVLQRSDESWIDSSEQVKHYVKEIRLFFEQGMEFVGDLHGSIEIAKDGSIVWGESWQRAAQRDFVLAPHRYTTGLFSI